MKKPSPNFAAEKASGCDQARVVHKPRLLSDNGSSYASGDLAEWLGDRKMGHVRGAPYHTQMPLQAEAGKLPKNIH